MEQFQAKQPDPVELAATLSAQLDDALQELDTLKATNRELGMLIARAEAARDVLKELLTEVMRR